MSKPESMTRPLESMQLPGFVLERLPSPDAAIVCQLQLCPPSVATHRAIFDDGSMVVLICDRHALGIVAMGEYLKHELSEGLES